MGAIDADGRKSVWSSLTQEPPIREGSKAAAGDLRSVRHGVSPMAGKAPRNESLTLNRQFVTVRFGKQSKILKKP
jgi:hypothetical protein